MQVVVCELAVYSILVTVTITYELTMQ